MAIGEAQVAPAPAIADASHCLPSKRRRTGADIEIVRREPAAPAPPAAYADEAIPIVRLALGVSRRRQASDRCADAPVHLRIGAEITEACKALEVEVLIVDEAEAAAERP